MTTWARGAAGLFIVLALGCNPGPKLTLERFEQVHEGMTTDEVKALLGEPTTTRTASLPILGSVTRYVYDQDGSHAELIFRDGRLRAKAGHLDR